MLYQYFSYNDAYYNELLRHLVFQTLTHIILTVEYIVMCVISFRNQQQNWCLLFSWALVRASPISPVDLSVTSCYKTSLLLKPSHSQGRWLLRNMYQTLFITRIAYITDYGINMVGVIVSQINSSTANKYSMMQPNFKTVLVLASKATFWWVFGALFEIVKEYYILCSIDVSAI